jgi:hypothetical protein
MIRMETVTDTPQSAPQNACRCGWDGKGEHPCHWGAYTCRKPAKQRFYGAHLACLAGMQPKLGIHETWACDEHWDLWEEEWKAQLVANVKVNP